MSKDYRVKHDTIIQGKPTAEGSTVKLDDDAAKIYKGAGLIEEIKTDSKEGKETAEQEDLAKEEAAKIDQSQDKRTAKTLRTQ